jgi:Leucine-rich repeat (LRR) protein
MLKILYLHDTQVSDLSPIESLKNLNTLNFENTKVTNLDILKKMLNLESVYYTKSKNLN